MLNSLLKFAHNPTIALLNVRSDPGLGNQVVTQFESQTSVAVLGERDGWLLEFADLPEYLSN